MKKDLTEHLSIYLFLTEADLHNPLPFYLEKFIALGERYPSLLFVLHL